MKLSRAQEAALEAVCAPDPLFDSVVTWRGWSDWSAAVVNGKAASSLEALGLVRCRTNPDYRGNRLVDPTPAGREAFRDLFGQEATT